MRDISPKTKKKTRKLKDEKAGGRDDIEIKKDVFIAWQAPEDEYRRKDVSWYWLSLILAIILVALALWQKNFLFAVFVLIAWMAVVNLAGRFPTIWEFRIDEKGISIDNKSGNNKFYPFSDIDFFDIHPASKDYKGLALKLKSRFSPLVKINIHADNEEKIKTFLLKFLRQKEIEQSLIDSLAKLIRF